MNADLTHRTGRTLPSLSLIKSGSPTADSHSRKRKILFFAILPAFLLINVLLQSAPVTHGLPYLYHEDEAHHFQRTVSMVKEGSFNPHYFLKPSLHFYLRMPLVAASFLWEVRQGRAKRLDDIITHDPHGLGGYSLSASHPGIVKWNRWFSVLLLLTSLAISCILVFSLTDSLLASVASAFVMTASPFLLQESAVVGVDVVMTVFAATTLLLTLRLYENPSWQVALSSGLVAGLTVSSKYNALPISLLPIIALVASNRDYHPGLLLLTALTPPLGFLLGSPFILVELPLFLNHLAYEIWHYGVAGHAGHMAPPGLPQALFYLEWLATYGIGLGGIILALVGSIGLVRSNLRIGTIILAFPTLYLFLMINQKTNFVRNMMVLLPFLAILSGLGFSFILKTARQRLPSRMHWITPSLLFALLAGSLGPWTLEAIAAKRSNRESRKEMALWLLENPLGSETAIDGLISLAPRLKKDYRLFSLDKKIENVAVALSQGYTTAVLHGSRQGRAFSFLELVKRFGGDPEVARVPQNPQIEVFNVDTTNLTQHLLEQPQHLPESTLQLTPEGLLTCESLQQEGHCWTQHLVERVPVSANTEGNAITLEIMSPWPQQRVTFSALSEVGGRVVKLGHVTPSPPGAWKRFSIDGRALHGNTLLVTTAKIQHPSFEGSEGDSRPLGVAIRPPSNTAAG